MTMVRKPTHSLICNANELRAVEEKICGQNTGCRAGVKGGEIPLDHNDDDDGSKRQSCEVGLVHAYRAIIQ